MYGSWNMNRFFFNLMVKFLYNLVYIFLDLILLYNTIMLYYELIINCESLSLSMTLAYYTSVACRLETHNLMHEFKGLDLSIGRCMLSSVLDNRLMLQLNVKMEKYYTCITSFDMMKQLFIS